MKKTTFLAKNLLLLKKFDIRLFYRLERTDPTQLEFCHTEKNQLNLKRFYDSSSFYYHSEIDAQEEAYQWFCNLDLKGITVLFVYGIGLGYYYKAAKEWLKSNSKHALVFLEEDPGVIHRLLETKIGHEILKDHQVHLMHYEDLLNEKAAFNELSWTYVLCPFKISVLKLYEEVNPNGFLELKNRISFDMVQKNNIVEEYFQYGIPFFRNFYPNLLEIPQSYLGNHLFDQFKNNLN